MKRYKLSIVPLLVCMNAQADLDFSLGYGTEFGNGLGLQVSAIEEKIKYYGSFGFSGYSSLIGSSFGYGLGADYNFDDTNSSVGLYLGSVYTLFAYDEAIKYHGVAVNYIHHFSGFNEKGWQLGLGSYYGETSKSVVEPKKEGVRLNIGYQY